MAALGLTLRRAMRTAGMSPEDLAATSGVDREVVDAIVAGEGDPKTSLETLVRLGAALDLESGTLLEGVEWIRPEDGRRGHYLLTDPAGMPAIDQEAVDASMPRYLDRKFEIATMIRLAGALKIRPAELLSGAEKFVRGPA
jgi:transcriptional regulator with XRE-family HTH domain